MQKSILITGCSSGIGLSAATILKQRNYRVFAAARKTEDIARLAQQGFECVQMDLDNSKSIQMGVQSILAKTGGTLDALFNNAGFIQAGAVEDLTRDALRQQFETNFFGLAELTNLIIPVMREQGHGRIIQNSSILGMISMPFRGAYCASKFAVEGLTNALRQELRRTPITVSMLVPGPIHSNLRRNSYVHQQAILQKGSVHQASYAKMVKHFFQTTASGRSFTQQPEAVVKKLLCALEDKRPKAHYYITFPAHLFAILRRILPDSILDSLICRINQGEINSD
jgi:short-subunit dehydrogenase